MTREAQAAADQKNMKSFYSFSREVFGTSQAPIAHTITKNDRELYSDTNSTQNKVGRALLGTV